MCTKKLNVFFFLFSFCFSLCSADLKDVQSITTANKIAPHSPDILSILDKIVDLKRYGAVVIEDSCDIDGYGAVVMLPDSKTGSIILRPNVTCVIKNIVLANFDQGVFILEPGSKLIFDVGVILELACPYMLYCPSDDCDSTLPLFEEDIFDTIEPEIDSLLTREQIIFDGKKENSFKALYVSEASQNRAPAAQNNARPQEKGGSNLYDLPMTALHIHNNIPKPQIASGPPPVILSGQTKPGQKIALPVSTARKRPAQAQGSARRSMGLHVSSQDVCEYLATMSNAQCE